MSFDLGELRDRNADLSVEIAAPEDGEKRVVVEAASAATLLDRLRAEAGEAPLRLIDLTAIARQGTRSLEIVYRLATADRSDSLRIHARLDRADPTLASVTSAWPAAVWLEREVFDLFGIVFKGHPDLRRILLEPGFEGAPLRGEERR